MARKWDDDWNYPRQRNRRGTTISVVAVACFVIGLVTGIAVVPHTQRDVSISVAPSQSTSSGTAPGGSESGSVPPELQGNVISRIYQTVRPSIVTITAVTSGTTKSSPSGALGTGFFIDNQGDIATNEHVIDGATKITVSFGNQTLTAHVIGSDKLDDLAVIHVQPQSGMTPLTFGSASSLQPGDLVIAIGNPDSLTASVSSGIVSGLNRSVPMDSGRLMSGLIQTDAALNPGNSGGPLFNDQGQVVGIDWGIASPVEGSVGIGFAIPIDKFKSVLGHLMQGQAVDHPWIGITGIGIDALAVQQYNLPVSSGVLVVTTVKDGPAAKAGIQGDSGGSDNPKGDGDIITAIDGKTVDSVETLTSYIAQHHVGDSVVLTVLRHGKTLHITIVLGPWPANAGQ